MEEKNKTAVLEESPAWQLARELASVTNSLLINRKNDGYMPRPGIQSLAEQIMIETGLVLEKAEDSLGCNYISSCMENLTRLKSVAYLMYDKKEITRDSLAEILLCHTKISREFEAFKKDMEEQKEKKKQEYAKLHGEMFGEGRGENTTKRRKK